jgi:propionyl-CoA carboxylase alpha chain
VEGRAAQISGAMPNHGRGRCLDCVVTLAGREFRLSAKDGEIVFGDGPDGRVPPAGGKVEVEWRPGDTLAHACVDDKKMTLKFEPRTEGFRIRYRGADMDVRIRSPRIAELAALMPEKQPPDTSKMLLCPMPGLIVRIDVAVGDEVQDGQALCMVEAMKMENVLRAERKGVVARVNASEGDSMGVDDVIMEFE